ncbi:uncharacterized protein LOC103314918 [Tribolium castaneum]|uniref:C2H2-type domain-containing protein n=1 Tax=Tribolium castaneum TaxID=7070 RepID=D6WKM0_TRICA|nr:PREDICTED: uncharacterized protein LOC103314918 [Tribolium castaneum]EFA03009.1 hypothetical protein TcasGA2_TC010432 [Tribolium castaneum]|eukprot:XP_008200434.1 PREDICTED: uncharacterized protein LOC103314918 [Tribolium castaneum]
MTDNIPTTPYVVQISEPLETIHLAEQVDSQLQIAQTVSNPHILVESMDKPLEIIEEPCTSVPQEEPLGFQIMYPEEQPCVVKIVYPQELSLIRAPNLVKRGRPKKKKHEAPQTDANTESKTDNVEASKASRTRSGRLVKLPKHIEKDFKKFQPSVNDREVQVTDFERVEEKENSKIEFAQLQTRKRVVKAQFKCPKCFKAYLGKNKMIQHLKKNPDHGPLPEGYQQYNFDVWNYLFDITQKCKAGQRGVKFCEELSNLLHNVQLLKSALFKTVTDNKNCVQIDKVLGNAIGLAPGKYKFDENELYKDVTVLKLITNSDFFKPNNVNSTAKNKTVEEAYADQSENKKIKTETPNLDESLPQSGDSGLLNDKPTGGDFNLISPDASKVQDVPTVDNFDKKMDVDSQIGLSSDLLSENLLLPSLPNPRNSVEELMLTGVDNSSNLLDNSTSSDEVMNVDQFVNERFKKIIEPDIELSNTSLNLDLPSLELFQFHTS